MCKIVKKYDNLKKSPTRINYINIHILLNIYVYIRLMINNLNCESKQKNKQLLFKFKKLYKLYATNTKKANKKRNYKLLCKSKQKFKIKIKYEKKTTIYKLL